MLGGSNSSDARVHGAEGSGAGRRKRTGADAIVAVPAGGGADSPTAAAHALGQVQVWVDWSEEFCEWP